MTDLSRTREVENSVRYDSSRIDQGLVYYSFEYRHFLEQLLGCETRYIIGGTESNVVALMPMAIVDGPFGRVLNSLPFFGSHGAPVANEHSPVRVSQLIYNLEDEIKKDEYRAVTLIENPFMPLSSSEIGQLELLRVVESRVSQVTHWNTSPPGSVEELLLKFHGKMRNAIRKGQSTGQTVVSGSSRREWDFLLMHHQRSIEAKGGVAKSEEVFRSLKFAFGTNLKLHCGYVDHELSCALLTIRYGSTIEYFVPVVSEQFRNMQVLPHLISQVMFDAFRDGVTLWNWGGTWKSQVSLMNFKSRFGAINREYRYLNWHHPSLKDIDSQSIQDHYRYWYVRKF